MPPPPTLLIVLDRQEETSIGSKKQSYKNARLARNVTETGETLYFNGFLISS